MISNENIQFKNNSQEKEIWFVFVVTSDGGGRGVGAVGPKVHTSGYKIKSARDIMYSKMTTLNIAI